MKSLFITRGSLRHVLNRSQALYRWHHQNPEIEMHILTEHDQMSELYPLMGIHPTMHQTDEGLDAFLESNAWEHTFETTHHFDSVAVEHLAGWHPAEAYAELLGVPLLKISHTSDIPWYRPELRPVLVPPNVNIPDADLNAILIAPFSGVALPWDKWEVILRLARTYGYPIRFLGARNERTPLQLSEDEYLLGKPLGYVAKVMSYAKLLISNDNGLVHLAAALALPTFMITDATNDLWVPFGNPNVMWVHVTPTVDTAKLVTYMRTCLSHYWPANPYYRPVVDVVSQ